MKFCEQLNEIITLLNCTASELVENSGLSPATLSRYRSGERVPDLSSENFKKLCSAIVVIAKDKGIEKYDESSVKEILSSCSDIKSTDKEKLRDNFNELISVLNINVAKLCKFISYDTSSVFRIRNGQRQPSDPDGFALKIAGFVASEYDRESDFAILSNLMNCSIDSLKTEQNRRQKVKEWLLSGKAKKSDDISDFLAKLNDFDLNKYIKAIKFDELKVPVLPFQLQTTKTYFGIKNMMTSELDFLKATVMSKSLDSVIMYSDMPMEEMSKDPEFPKKWMFGMALMLKKGLHLNMIHNIDRPFNEMMLGLESYIPMYMTGQITPYYLKTVQNDVFMHFLKVSGACALTGEAINGYHGEGKYYLTKNREEVAYYRKRAERLLSKSLPLMKIYRKEKQKSYEDFMSADALTQGNRRMILSGLPIFTLSDELLYKILQKNNVSEENQKQIFAYFETYKNRVESIMQNGNLTVEIPVLSKAEFEKYPTVLPLSDIFLEDDIVCSFDDYQKHLELTEEYEKTHQNFFIKKNDASPFRNIQIKIHEGKWVVVSKNKTPSIHFLIRHPKMQAAFENMIVPVVDD